MTIPRRPMSRQQASSLYLTAAFILTTLVSGALIALAWRSFRNVTENAALVRRTLLTQRDLNAFRGGMVDAETAQRGFLLTGAAEYLTPFDSAAKSARTQIATLRVRTADNPSVLARIGRLDTLSEAKLTELRRTLSLAEKGDRDSALEVVRKNVGDSIMRSIRLVVHDAVSVQDSLLISSETALENAVHTRNIVSLALGLILGLVLLWIAFMLKRLRRYQDLVTLCAWSKTVNYRGEWMSFEEYLRRRFRLSTTHGISPAALATMQSEISREDGMT